jgi:hypothetical protein
VILHSCPEIQKLTLGISWTVLTLGSSKKNLQHSLTNNIQQHMGSHKCYH